MRWTRDRRGMGVRVIMIVVMVAGRVIMVGEIVGMGVGPMIVVVRGVLTRTSAFEPKVARIPELTS